jgi:hypothetical protein
MNDLFMECPTTVNDNVGACEYGATLFNNESNIFVVLQINNVTGSLGTTVE